MLVNHPEMLIFRAIGAYSLIGKVTSSPKINPTFFELPFQAIWIIWRRGPRREVATKHLHLLPQLHVGHPDESYPKKLLL